MIKPLEKAFSVAGSKSSCGRRPGVADDLASASGSGEWVRRGWSRESQPRARRHGRRLHISGSDGSLDYPLLLGEAHRNAIALSYIQIAAALLLASYQLDTAVLNGLGRLNTWAV